MTTGHIHRLSRFDRFVDHLCRRPECGLDVVLTDHLSSDFAEP